MSVPRRPWWLAFDRPGQAWWFLAFAVFLGVGSLARSIRDLDAAWTTVGLLLVLVWVGTPVVSLIAYHRHPDWIDRSWARRLMPRRRLRAFAVGTFLSLALTIGAGIVAVATSSHLALLAVAVGGVALLICASTVAAYDEAPTAPVDR